MIRLPQCRAFTTVEAIVLVAVVAILFTIVVYPLWARYGGRAVQTVDRAWRGR